MPQSFFPITPVQIASQATQYVWADRNITTFGVPAGVATGAVVYINNSDPGVRPWGIRKKGSADARFQNMSGNAHCWGIVGVDTSGILQFRNDNAGIPGYVELWLVGYTRTGVTMLTNGVAIGPPGLGAWGDIDLSAQLPAGALGAIVEVYAFGALPTAWGLRQKGSADNRISNTLNRKNQFTAIIGCDANRIIEGYRDNVNTEFYLVGYITDGATFYLNAVDMTIVSIGGVWQTCPNLVPANGVMAFIEIDAGAGVADSVRKDAGFSRLYGVKNHAWGIVQPNASRQIQAIRTNAATTFSMTGYAHFTPPTVQTLAATGVT